jgi:catechol 2,3-dioxygenase-like lactoylglutathione lyase family enzyme
VIAAYFAFTTSAQAVREVSYVAVTVSDLERSVAFFRDILTFESENTFEYTGEPHERLEGVFGLRARTTVMRLGEERLALTQYLAPEGRPLPVDSQSNDGWFQHLAIVVSDMDQAYARLREHHVRHASSGPQTLPDWNPNAGGIKAFYFKDPDGHALEIIWFPSGKGDARWQRPADKLFLGIDHTAIVVQDTDASLRFYRDVLDFRVVGESENYGTEQEHLNNVFGARLRITGMRAESGPGVEFLEYLAPRDGRPYPADARSNDTVHWEIVLRCVNVEALSRRLTANWVSPGIVPHQSPDETSLIGLVVRDPDGHFVRLVEENQ